MQTGVTEPVTEQGYYMRHGLHDNNFFFQIDYRHSVWKGENFFFFVKCL